MPASLLVKLIVSLILCSATALSAEISEPLPQSVVASINALPRLFDGKSLDGWIQTPIAPTTLSGSDIADPRAAAARLLAPKTPAEQAIAAHLDSVSRTSLSSVAAGTQPPKVIAGAVAKALNGVVMGPSLLLDPALQPLASNGRIAGLGSFGQPADRAARINRLVLEYALPDDLSPSPESAWIVRDGALASTGAGRGVLSTTWSAAHYRLFFQMRHVSGKPDHAACMLVFCQEPKSGEKPLDALGGIQFQVPNGGHWDYRPGHNNGGSGFTKPAKTDFDPHTWSQVELLVDASTGTARMAVAQPIGTYAVENLDFKDAGAGRIGPIALQMHNSGLFDEYREIHVEIDPKEDRLLTVK